LRLFEEQKKLVEEKKKEVPFLDEENLRELLETIKYCLDHSAKIVILLLSYDKPTAIYNQVFSVEFFVEYLQNVKLKRKKKKIFKD
jgi:3-phosphoglycerate kinase